MRQKDAGLIFWHLMVLICSNKEIFIYYVTFYNFYFRRQSPSQAAAAAMLEISMFFSFLSLPPLYPHHCTVDQYKWDHCYLFHIKWSLMFWLRNYFTHTYMSCTCVYIKKKVEEDAVEMLNRMKSNGKR